MLLHTEGGMECPLMPHYHRGCGTVNVIEKSDLLLAEIEDVTLAVYLLQLLASSDRQHALLVAVLHVEPVGRQLGRTSPYRLRQAVDDDLG